jgi:hypothetical protein
VALIALVFVTGYFDQILLICAIFVRVLAGKVDFRAAELRFGHLNQGFYFAIETKPGCVQVDGAKNHQLLGADIVFIYIPHEGNLRKPVLPGLSFDNNFIFFFLDLGTSLLFDFFLEVRPVLIVRNELELVGLVVLLEDGLLALFVGEGGVDEQHALPETIAHYLLLPLERPKPDLHRPAVAKLKIHHF